MMRSQVCFILIISAILCIGCDSPVHYKDVRVQSGLEDFWGGHYEWHTALLFISSEVGFIIGRTVKEGAPTWGEEVSKDFWYKNAMCWKTTDGGKTWAGQYITDGEAKEIVEKDGTIYLLIEKKEAERDKWSDIYISRDQGCTWKKKCEIPAQDSYHLHVMDSSHMIINAYFELIETKDGGKTWKKIPTRGTFYKEFYTRDHVYYFYLSHLPYKDGDYVVRQRLVDGKYQQVQLPDKLQGEGGIDDIIFCSNRNELRVYRIHENMSLSHLHTFKRGHWQRLDYVAKHGSRLYISIHTNRANLFTRRRCFFYSPDGGNTWENLGNGAADWLTPGEFMTNVVDNQTFRMIFYNENSEVLGTFSCEL